MVDARDVGMGALYVLLFVGIVIGYWFLTYFVIAPVVITVFNLQADILTTSLVIFFGGDSGILALAIWGKRRG